MPPKDKTQPNLVVIAHDIRSLHNVGSIFRSCDAFGVEKLYLTGATGMPPRKEIAKVALGSEHRVVWEGREAIALIIDELRADGYTVVALETGEGSQPIDAYQRPQKLALIVGNEVDGLARQLLDHVDAILEISMPGTKRSLNVSVAMGIALFALTRYRG